MPIINHFCITSKNYQFLHNLNLEVILSGSDDKDLSKFPNSWHKDNSGINISEKNKHFGTLSSHYWIWKNKFNYFADNDWIGINHYRRFWVKGEPYNIDSNNLKENMLLSIPDDNNFEILLPDKIILKDLKLSKLIKKGFKNYIKSPSILFNRRTISINLHFDLFHGYNFLNKAADLLDNEDKEDFKQYISNMYSFYPLQIFVSQKKYINKLYEKTFEWIFKCEQIFSKIELKGYGKERIYDFLAERYFSFYFEKNLKIKTWPYILLEETLYEI
tara:strand:- start:514 stop:1335 length:822 start_codon:yes stop_codon:yes gene_type:complete